MERRRFLRILGGAVAAGASTSACASALPVVIGRTEGALRVSLDEHPELGSAGGSLRVRTPEDGRLIYLLAQGDGVIVALSPICTHQGCTVGIEGAYLVCPCHGSTYEWDGTVVRGPAAQPLTRLPVRVGPGRVLVVETGGS